MSRDHNATLMAFEEGEFQRAKVLLATQVAAMMGRKLEEGDWTSVYCKAKRIPDTGWSNLHIDVSYNGLGVEQKLLRCSALKGKPIKNVCGTTMMHPAATRSIRIADVDAPAETVKLEIFGQYAELIGSRRNKVRETSGGVEPDMRLGWCLWEDSLTEFLYFEQRLLEPDPEQYYAEWNETPARGARKSSKSLWIYERETNQKRFSVTTSAGIKIQPYFDVPSISDENLYYFRVQSEPIDAETIQIWVSATTARALVRILGNLDRDNISEAILSAANVAKEGEAHPSEIEELAVPIKITGRAFAVFQKTWVGVSDEHRAQLFVESLNNLEGGPQ